MLKTPFAFYLKYNALHLDCDLIDNDTGEILYSGKDKDKLSRFIDRNVIKLIGSGTKFIFILQ